MDDEMIVFSRPADQLSCIVGNLFAELDPPCGISSGQGCLLVLFGRVRSTGETAVLRVFQDRCEYTGPPGPLDKVLNGHCPEKERRDNG